MTEASSWLVGEPLEHWNGAVSSDRKVVRRALTYWSHHRHLLPGPICFELSSTERLRGDWQRVLQASIGRCSCGGRRWMTPDHSVPFYEPPAEERYTLGPGLRHVALGPWGGDVQSTSLQLSAANGTLLQRIMPFSNIPRKMLGALGLGVLRGVKKGNAIFGQRTAAHEHGLELTDLANHLRTKGAPYRILTVVQTNVLQRPGITRAFSYFPYAVYSLDISASTVVIGISRNNKFIDTSDRADSHVCD